MGWEMVPDPAERGFVVLWKRRSLEVYGGAERKLYTLTQSGEGLDREAAAGQGRSHPDLALGLGEGLLRLGQPAAPFGVGPGFQVNGPVQEVAAFGGELEEAGCGQPLDGFEGGAVDQLQGWGRCAVRDLPAQQRFDLPTPGLLFCYN